jgi:hypothetical protein
MYVISGNCSVIITLEFSVQVTNHGCVFMMVEHTDDGSRKEFILPASDIKLRRQYYDVTRFKFASYVCNNYQSLQDLIREYKQWTVPDFTTQCKIMALLCNQLY